MDIFELADDLTDNVFTFDTPEAAFVRWLF